MPEPFGQILRQARENRGISIAEAAQATRIRVWYLTALEEDRLADLPSMVHVRGFLNNYADYLGLPAQELLDRWSGKAEEMVSDTAAVPPVEQKPARRKFLFSEPAAPRQPVVIQTPQASQSGENAAQIFAEIGRVLNAQRELLGLSLGEVEKAIHVRLHYLKALEDGRIDAIPSPVQGRGMLANYASFLNLDSDQLLNRFADGLQTRRAEMIETLPPEARPGAARRVPGEAVVVEGPREPRRPSPFSRIFSLDLVLGAGMIVFLVGFAIYAFTRVAANTSQAQITSAAPGISEILLETQTLEPTASPTPTQQPSASGALPPDQTAQAPGLALPTASSAGEIQVVVVARNDAWLQVSVDGRIEFQGRAEPGLAYPFAGDSRIELLTGNAGALQVYYNQADLGLLGEWSEVVRLIFGVEGLQTPTPTVTPTATSTPRTTPTLPAQP